MLFLSKYIFFLGGTRHFHLPSPPSQHLLKMEKDQVLVKQAGSTTFHFPFPTPCLLDEGTAMPSFPASLLPIHSLNSQLNFSPEIALSLMELLHLSLPPMTRTSYIQRLVKSTALLLEFRVIQRATPARVPCRTGLG